jgi:hypothetical protein
VTSAVLARFNREVRSLIHINKERFTTWTRVLIRYFVWHAIPVLSDELLAVGLGEVE